MICTRTVEVKWVQRMSPCLVTCATIVFFCFCAAVTSADKTRFDDSEKCVLEDRESFPLKCPSPYRFLTNATTLEDFIDCCDPPRLEEFHRELKHFGYGRLQCPVATPFILGVMERCMLLLGGMAVDDDDDAVSSEDVDVNQNNMCANSSARADAQSERCPVEVELLLRLSTLPKLWWSDGDTAQNWRIRDIVRLSDIVDSYDDPLCTVLALLVAHRLSASVVLDHPLLMLNTPLRGIMAIADLTTPNERAAFVSENEYVPAMQKLVGEWPVRLARDVIRQQQPPRSLFEEALQRAFSAAITHRQLKPHLYQLVAVVLDVCNQNASWCPPIPSIFRNLVIGLETGSGKELTLALSAAVTQLLAVNKSSVRPRQLITTTHTHLATSASAANAGFFRALGLTVCWLGSAFCDDANIVYARHSTALGTFLNTTCFQNAGIFDSWSTTHWYLHLDEADVALFESPRKGERVMLTDAIPGQFLALTPYIRLWTLAHVLLGENQPDDETYTLSTLDPEAAQRLAKLAVHPSAKTPPDESAKPAAATANEHGAKSKLSASLINAARFQTLEDLKKAFVLTIQELIIRHHIFSDLSLPSHIVHSLKEDAVNVAENLWQVMTVYTLNRQYTVQNGRVVLIDEMTGETKENHFLDHGGHVFLHLKEKLALHPPQPMSCSLSIHSFNRIVGRETFVGFTGTPGSSEQCTGYNSTYNATCVQLPSPYRRLEARWPGVIVDVNEGHFRRVADEASAIAQNGWNVIVVVEYPADVYRMRGKFDTSSVVVVVCAYSPLACIEHQRKKSTSSSGSVTIVSKQFNRGVDARSTGQRQMLIMTFVPDSRSAFLQYIGRVCRMGDSCDVRFVVSANWARRYEKRRSSSQILRRNSAASLDDLLEKYMVDAEMVRLKAFEQQVKALSVHDTRNHVFYSQSEHGPISRELRECFARFPEHVVDNSTCPSPNPFLVDSFSLGKPDELFQTKRAVKQCIEALTEGPCKAVLTVLGTFVAVTSSNLLWATALDPEKTSEMVKQLQHTATVWEELFFQFRDHVMPFVTGPVPKGYIRRSLRMKCPTEELKETSAYSGVVDLGFDWCFSVHLVEKHRSFWSTVATAALGIIKVAAAFAIGPGFLGMLLFTSGLTDFLNVGMSLYHGVPLTFSLLDQVVNLAASALTASLVAVLPTFPTVGKLLSISSPFATATAVFAISTAFSLLSEPLFRDMAGAGDAKADAMRAFQANKNRVMSLMLSDINDGASINAQALTTAASLAASQKKVRTEKRIWNAVVSAIPFGPVAAEASGINDDHDRIIEGWVREVRQRSDAMNVTNEWIRRLNHHNVVCPSDGRSFVYDWDSVLNSTAACPVCATTPTFERDCVAIHNATLAELTQATHIMGEVLSSIVVRVSKNEKGAAWASHAGQIVASAVVQTHNELGEAETSLEKTAGSSEGTTKKRPSASNRKSEERRSRQRHTRNAKSQKVNPVRPRRVGEMPAAVKNEASPTAAAHREPTKTSTVLFSAILDVLPVVGNAKSVAELVTGRDLLTGEKTNRWLAAAGCIPFGNLAKGAKTAAKLGISATSAGMKWTPKTVSIAGKQRRIYQRADLFDPMQKITRKGMTKTNVEWMSLGKAPVGFDGKKVILHHVGQMNRGSLAELLATSHQKFTKVLHRSHGKDHRSTIDRARFDTERNNYWKLRAKDFQAK